jgi:hypothetical protein
MGMDAILSLHGVLLVIGNEQINPLFRTSNEANDPDPMPVLAI